MPLDDGCLIGSNRDDQATRPTSRVLHTNDQDISYIMDQESQGTWLSINNYGELAVVLNNIDQKKPAQKSRGMLPLQMQVPHIEKLDEYAWHQYVQITPSQSDITHAVWDQQEQITTKLSSQTLQSWRANTLYTQKEITDAFLLLQERQPRSVDDMLSVLEELYYDEEQIWAKEWCITKSSTIVRYHKETNQTEFHHWEWKQKIIEKII